LGENLGSVAIMSKSREAKGTRHIDRLEANITDAFRRFASKSTATITIVVKPYDGLREARDYVWQVKDVRLEAR